MKKIVQLSLVFSLLIFASSCDKKQKENEELANNSQAEQPVVTLSNELNQPTANDSNQKLAAMTFKENNFDFGQIKEGDIVTHDFEFTNTGEVPLIITNAVGSCGCTIPEYPKQPILPGANGIIKVQFNSTGFEGEKNKEVFIEANTKNKPEKISFKATVNKK